MPIPSRISAAPARPAEQGQLIVARDHVALCQALQEPFAARGTFTVVVDPAAGPTGGNASRRY